MRILIILLLGLMPYAASHSQSARFRGINGDGVYTETGLLTSWPEGGPVLNLTCEGIGTGYSSAVVDQGSIYITGMKSGKDYLTAIRPDGSIKWQVEYGTSWAKSFPDTRSTPTIDGDRIYIISGTGRLGCFSTVDGKEIWSAETDTDFGSRWHKWGVAESVLVVDDLAICTPAGEKAAVVAYDKYTGKLKWQSKPTSGQRSYASPVIFKWKQFRYVLACTTTELLAVVPETGEVVWVFNHWQADRDANGDAGHIFTNNPTIQENGIFLSRGYDYPCMMLTVSEDGLSVSEKWINQTLDNHHHGVMVYEGALYGSNWISNGKGNWACLDWKTGAVNWETPWNNKGPIILADGLFYIMDEKSGHVGLVKPDPAKFELISSFRIEKGTGPYWSHPTIYNGQLLIRHGDVLMGFDVKKR